MGLLLTECFCPPHQIHMLTPKPPSVSVFGDRAFKEEIKFK